MDWSRLRLDRSEYWILTTRCQRQKSIWPPENMEHQNRQGHMGIVHMVITKRCVRSIEHFFDQSTLIDEDRILIDATRTLTDVSRTVTDPNWVLTDANRTLTAGGIQQWVIHKGAVIANRSCMTDWGPCDDRFPRSPFVRDRSDGAYWKHSI